jgi:hypothetical protein
MTDNDSLAELPFAFRETKSGLVHITYQGSQVTTLSGKAAQRFLSAVEGADDHTAQLAMAKATGNFKRGNEKQAKIRRS